MRVCNCACVVVVVSVCCCFVSNPTERGADRERGGEKAAVVVVVGDLMSLSLSLSVKPVPEIWRERGAGERGERDSPPGG